MNVLDTLKQRGFLKQTVYGEELAVSVTMGGKDVTDSVYENGKITIDENMVDEVKITVIATGFLPSEAPQAENLIKKTAQPKKEEEETLLYIQIS